MKNLMIAIAMVASTILSAQAFACENTRSPKDMSGNSESTYASLLLSSGSGSKAGSSKTAGTAN